MAKTSKRKRKTKDDAPGADPQAGVGHNSEKATLTLDEQRALFLQHRTSWNGWKAKQAVVDKLKADVAAALKNDGFTIKEMKIADDLADVKGEVRVKADVESRLRVAFFIGHPMGAQLDLFAQPDRTPSSDKAYDAGKMCSMENKPAKPPYAPDSEQHREFMRGYHEHQRQLAGGLKAPEEATTTH